MLEYRGPRQRVQHNRLSLLYTSQDSNFKLALAELSIHLLLYISTALVDDCSITTSTNSRPPKTKLTTNSDAPCGGPSHLAYSRDYRVRQTSNAPHHICTLFQNFEIGVQVKSKVLVSNPVPMSVIIVQSIAVYSHVYNCLVIISCGYYS